MNRLRRFLFNGIIMAVVSIAMRSVTVAFNVYISNKIGAVAMGLFTLITTVYGFAVTLATSGINLATTRLVAEKLGNTDSDTKQESSGEKSAEIRCILGRCVSYALFFGMLSASTTSFSVMSKNCMYRYRLMYVCIFPRFWS